MIGPSGRRWSDERTATAPHKSRRGRSRTTDDGPPDAGVMESTPDAASANVPSTGASAAETSPETGQALTYPSAEPTSLTGADRPDQPTYVPLVDVIDSADEMRVIVDTPGFEEDDISVEVSEDVLIVSAERDVETEEGEDRIRTERPQALERIVHLPTGLNVDDAWASSENGTTTVTFERDEDEQHNQIGFQ